MKGAKFRGRNDSVKHPVRPRNVLWPTDLSPLSLAAGRYAHALCAETGAQLHVIHVAPMLVPADATIPMMTGGDMLVGVTDTVTPAKRALKSLIAAQFRDSRTIKTTIVCGNAWSEICEYARRNQIDLIVIATHGVTGIRHLLIGSTAERVVQHAACPVLTIKSFDPDRGRHSARRVRQVARGARSNRGSVRC